MRSILQQGNTAPDIDSAGWWLSVARQSPIRSTPRPDGGHSNEIHDNTVRTQLPVAARIHPKEILAASFRGVGLLAPQCRNSEEHGSKRARNSAGWRHGESRFHRSGDGLGAGVEPGVRRWQSGGYSMTPARQARATISARSPAPSLRPIRARWFFTVNADNVIRVPMSLFEHPSATRVSTWISRVVS